MQRFLVKEREFWDEGAEEFVTVKGGELLLEHSLLSLSKWESKWKKPFLGREKNRAEIIDYVRCMTLNRVDSNIYLGIDDRLLNQINAYIEDPMTATTFSAKQKSGVRGKQQTAETIYWEMITLGIPFSCERWHLNKLLTLIQVCIEMEQPAKKMSAAELARKNSALNAARRKAARSRG